MNRSARSLSDAQEEPVRDTSAAQPTQEQLVELRRIHPVPWRVSGRFLVDATGQLVTLLDTAQLVADAVNAYVAGAHHSEAAR